jgi:uncharacterized membrane protein YfcA
MSHPTLAQAALAAAAAAVATAVNAIAGGGTFIAFPVLTGVGGLTEKAANVACTLGIWPGSLASTATVGRSVAALPRRMTVAYTLLALAGGGVGAELLEHTSDHAFALAIPWLLLFATTVFALGDRVARWAGRGDAAAADVHAGWAWFVGGVQLVLSIYGGYFGAGMGILTLAGLSLVGLPDLRQVNVLKVLMSTATNLSAAVVFLFGPVEWRFVAPMAAAGVVGGFVGMLVAQRLPRRVLRAAILTIASGLTAAYFWKVYGR